MFVIFFHLCLSVSGAALDGAQQIWQCFPFISFDIWFLLPRKWKATQHGPTDPGWWTCLFFHTISVVKIVVWFSQVSFVCVEGMSLSMYSSEFERRERERVSGCFRRQMNKTWTSAVCSTAFDCFEPRCLCWGVCECTNVCRFQPPHHTTLPFSLVIMLSGQKKGLQESNNKENQWVIWTAGCKRKCVWFILSEAYSSAYLYLQSLRVVFCLRSDLLLFLVLKVSFHQKGIF